MASSYLVEAVNEILSWLAAMQVLKDIWKYNSLLTELIEKAETINDKLLDEGCKKGMLYTPPNSNSVFLIESVTTETYISGRKSISHRRLDIFSKNKIMNDIRREHQRKTIHDLQSPIYDELIELHEQLKIIAGKFEVLSQTSIVKRLEKDIFRIEPMVNNHQEETSDPTR